MATESASTLPPEQEEELEGWGIEAGKGRKEEETRETGRGGGRR